MELLELGRVDLAFDSTYERDEWLELHGYQSSDVGGEERFFHPRHPTLSWRPTGRWCGELRTCVPAYDRADGTGSRMDGV